MLNHGLFSSQSSEWETPQWLFDLLDREFHFGLDAAANPQNAKCSRYYGKGDWQREWDAPAVWLNPPYGRHIGQWVKRAHDESRKHCNLVVCLLPARTDTHWWHTWVMWASEIRLIQGRLRFSEQGPAPFPSCIVVFRGWERRRPSLGPTIDARYRIERKGGPRIDAEVVLIVRKEGAE